MDKYQWGWSWFSDSAMKVKRGKPWEDDYRIPNDTYGHHYDLYLHPDLEAGTFSGKVTVHITASNQVKQLSFENLASLLKFNTYFQRDFFVVHQKYHTITKTELRDDAGKMIISSASAYEPNEFWVVEPECAVPAGNYTIYMEFNGGGIYLIVKF